MKMLKPVSRIRTILALIIAHLPANALRVGLYSLAFGYRFGAGSRISLGTLITCASFRCGPKTVIGRGTLFIGPFAVEIGEGVFIGRFNRFTAGALAADAGKREMGYALRLIIGDRVLINDSHFFDVYGQIRIGEETWIAGIESQFWTHGASVMDRDIDIGANCYLGSAVRFAPGAAIGDRCVVGLGSVVVSRIAENDVVISGHPAKKLREIAAGDSRKFTFEMQ